MRVRTSVARHKAESARRDGRDGGRDGGRLMIDGRKDGDRFFVAF